ncbi:arachidonate 12-lipoxygenase, 12R-type-like [Hippoglossus hippoglossus]|uniref:arachidonate 12-lipoxygenase, 12R-type-like n=1 Tax=Hippoglossus hippoglossus TaxID=8267 RepID=UPI00148D9619|nr:arachidonate 12-lipoxygenase, 12R-type-like [Hippoglossus hippoglossus]
MAEYKLQVSTGDMPSAGTQDHVSVTLIGSDGESEKTELDNFGKDFCTGKTGTYTVKTSPSLGKLLLVKVEKDPYLHFPEDEWYCSTIEVTTPEGDAILFSCHRWISRGEYVELRGGRAMKFLEDDHPLLIEHRKKELTLQKSLYQWKPLAEGLLHTSSFEHESELPDEIRFSKAKTDEMHDATKRLGMKFKSKGMVGSIEKWENVDDLKKLFNFQKTAMSEYVAEHWKEDDFYGFQFLNGINPTLIKRCSELPPNFPVTEEMVKPFLAEGSSLMSEIGKGNIFLYDQKKLEGIPTQVSNGESLTVTPGLCLFYLNPENKLMPIAIQLHQQPSEKNPIFLPSDLETDWLLAKIYIKNADMLDHEAVHHLMNTHFMGEVYTVATLRCFPVIHPLYKLLFPHFKSTLDINIRGREGLMGPNGIFTLSSAGIEGMTEIMRRSLREMTYSSVCLPENIAARGMESIPNYYYRDDGLKLWSIINSFVRGAVEYYYPSDADICKDTELQDWIREIFTKGLLSNKASGFPSSFHSIEELIRFITMVIFTVSVQHAAVNNGQFDYYYWTLNAALLLHKPPPTTKGQSSMETIMETLPNVGETVAISLLINQLSGKYSGVIPLGQYPEKRFEEPELTQMIQEFQAELSKLGEEIAKRNSKLEVSYDYLHPSRIENSVSI